MALQADISIGGVDLCKGRTPGLIGTLTLAQGLEQLTSTGNCSYAFLGARTVRIGPHRAPPPAAAPTAPQTPPPTVEAPVMTEVQELLVTATKHLSTFEKVPASITVVSYSQLATSGAVDARGAVSQAAGVTITNLGSGRDKILLRGLSDGAFTGHTRSTVGTFLDNVPITYNAPDPDLRLADVEGIEIIRGPQGALYGAGTLSGVYRIVTRQPQLGTYSADIAVGGALTQGGDPGHDVQAVLNLPIFKDHLGVRLVAYDEVDGGYLDNASLRQSNVDRTLRRGGRAAVRLNLFDSWDLTVAGTTQTLESNDTQYTTPAAGRLQRANRVQETHKNNFQQGRVTLSGTGFWGRIEYSGGNVRHNYASQYDASAAASLFGNKLATLGIYDEATKIDMTVQDTVYTSPKVGPFRLLIGHYEAESRETSGARLTTLALSGTPSQSYLEDRGDTLREGADYGEASIAFAKGWSLTAGGRQSKVEITTKSTVLLPLTGQSRVITRINAFKDWSPKVSIQYDLESGGMIYALASQGYRAGGYNSGGIVPLPGIRRAFRPDRLKNNEIGVKLKLLDRRLDVKSAFFYDTWTNIQTDQYQNSGLSYTANVGDGRNIGLEIEGNWRATQALSIHGNILISNPRITRVDPAFAAKVGDPLPGVPDYSLGGFVTYEQPLPRDLSLLLTAQLGLVGKTHLTFDSASAQTTKANASATLSAQLNGNDWTLAAFVTNPTNSQADTFAYGNPFSFGQVKQVTPERPRTLRLVYSRRF